MNESLTLIMIAGPTIGARYTVTTNGAIIGRSKISDICLQDELLSRQHCRIDWQNGFYLEDLDSSNGTQLNDAEIKRSSRPLAAGDIIALGTTKFLVDVPFQAAAATPTIVVTPPASAPTVVTTPFTPLPDPVATPTPTPTLVTTPAAVSEETSEAVQSDEPMVQTDLFKRDEDQAETIAEGGHFKRLIFPLVALLVLVVGATVALSFDFVFPAEKEPQMRQLFIDVTNVEFEYESLRVDAQHLFRYALKYDGPANQLHLKVDDLGGADRSFTKQKTLNEEGKKALVKLLKEAELEKIGNLFPEKSADGISFARRMVTIVRGMDVWSRTAENVQHKAFDNLCEKLEFFARNELEIWAAQYSIAELEAMGREQLAVAQRYWEQRDLGDDKLWLSIVAYKKGLSAIETLNPKPAYLTELNMGLQEAEALLAERYEDVHFQVEQAMNTQRYDVAIRQLQKIVRMIPDREDPRNRQASEKLLSVEQRRK